MPRPAALFACGIALAAIPGCQHASGDAFRCTGVDWRGLEKPLVGTEDTARSIAEAIIAENAADMPGGPYTLNVEDGGDHWIAYQFAEPRTLENRVVEIQFGGGVELLIDKCDGRVRRLRGQK